MLMCVCVSHVYVNMCAFHARLIVILDSAGDN